MTVAIKVAPDPQRRAMIAKVQIARKELGLDDGAYRAMLERITGQTTSAVLSIAQLAAVLDELKIKGWTPKIAGAALAQNGRRTHSERQADHPSANKARALWISLAQLGEVRDGSEAALEAFAKRQLKCDRLQWADQGQMFKLIEALKAIAQRAGWDQDVSGFPPDRAVVLLKRRLLNALCDRLGVTPPIIPTALLDRLIGETAARVALKRSKEP